MMSDIFDLKKDDVFKISSSDNTFKFIKLVKRKLPRIGTTYIAECIIVETGEKAKFTNAIKLHKNKEIGNHDGE